MELKLHFTNAVEISANTVRDNLIVRVLDNEHFWAENSLMRVPIDYSTQKTIPP